MLVLVGLMTYTTLVFLLRGSQATGTTTYSQLTRVMCGGPVMKVSQPHLHSPCLLQHQVEQPSVVCIVLAHQLRRLLLLVTAKK